MNIERADAQKSKIRLMPDHDHDGLPLPEPGDESGGEWARRQLAFARWKAAYDAVRVEPPELDFADTLPLWEALPGVFDGDDLYGIALDDLYEEQVRGSRAARREVRAYAEGCVACWMREGRIDYIPRDEEPLKVGGQLPGHLASYVRRWRKRGAQTPPPGAPSPPTPFRVPAPK